MQDRSNPFAKLADQARRNQDGCEQEMWREMKPQLERMVRRVLRWGPGASPLEQTIQRELDRLAGPQPPQDSAGWEPMIVSVARRLCQELLGRWRARRPARAWQDTQGEVMQPRFAATVAGGAALLSA